MKKERQDLFRAVKKHRFRRLTACTLALGGAFLATETARAAQLQGVGSPRNEHVVILHGVASGAWHNRPLARYLGRLGYDVINIDYPSTKYPLETLIRQEREVIRTALAGKTGPVHFIGHSMGGLLIRGILKEEKPAQLGRVILIGTPNHGSELADLLKNVKLYQAVYGPAGQQLTTQNARIQTLLGVPDYRFGVIAGMAYVDPTVIGPLIIPGEDDGMVSVESTKLDGMDDFIVVPHAAHVFQTLNKRVQKLIARYLQYGTFAGMPVCRASPSPINK